MCPSYVWFQERRSAVPTQQSGADAYTYVVQYDTFGCIIDTRSSSTQKISRDFSSIGYASPKSLHTTAADLVELEVAMMMRYAHHPYGHLFALSDVVLCT